MTDRADSPLDPITERLIAEVYRSMRAQGPYRTEKRKDALRDLRVRIRELVANARKPKDIREMTDTEWMRHCVSIAHGVAP